MNGKFWLTGRIGLIALFFLIMACQSGPEKQPALQEIYQTGMSAYEDSNYTDFLKAMKRANDLRPNHPSVIYNLASGQALTGNHDSALFWLNRYADLGMTGDPELDSDFKSVYDDPLFQAVVRRIKDNEHQIGMAEIVAVLPDSTLITEGLAFDPRSGSFFVSSVHQRKIMKIDSLGAISTFVQSASGGLGSVLGMTVDTTRNLLWVCSAIFNQTPPGTVAEDGQTGVYSYDLQTGNLQQKVMIPPDSSGHLLTDLVLAPNGDLYTSDSRSEMIFRLSAGSHKLEPFVAPQIIRAPQGMVVLRDQQTLLVADYARGLYRVDLPSRKVTALELSEPMCLLGIDGLCSDGKFLYAIQNGIRPQRVVRLTLDSPRKKIIKLEVLAANHPDFDEPTLGVIADGHLYFNGNSQWRFLKNDGTLANPENLQQPKIFVLPIE